jgi:hypothetical protein
VAGFRTGRRPWLQIGVLWLQQGAGRTPLPWDALYAGPVLSHAEWESARVVYEDLEYLAEEWTPAFDEPALRRISPMLRRPLVEGQQVLTVIVPQARSVRGSGHLGVTVRP